MPFELNKPDEGSVDWAQDVNDNFTAIEGAIDGAVPSTRLVSTTSPLTGGGDLSADRTLAIGTAGASEGDVLTSVSGVATWAAPTGGGASLPLDDDEPLLANAADATKEARFDLSGLSAGTERVYALPDADGTIALLEDMASTSPDVSYGTGSSDSVTITPAMMAVDGDSVLVWVSGTAGGTLSLTLTPAGGSPQDMVSNGAVLNPGFNWVIQGLLTRTGVASAVFSFTQGAAAAGHTSESDSASPRVVLTDLDWTVNQTVAAAMSTSGQINHLAVAPFGGAVAVTGAGSGTVPVPTAAEAPPLLVVRHRGGAPSLHRLSGGSSLSGAIGSTFGSAETTAPSWLRANSVVEYQGKIYAINTTSTTAHVVYEFDVSAGTWSTAYTATNSVSANARTGLHVVNTGAGPLLCFAYIKQSFPVQAFVVRFNGAWASSAGYATEGNNIQQGHVAASGGRLYLGASGAGAGRTLVCDPENLTVTTITPPGGAAGTRQFLCAHRSSVYLWMNSPSGAFADKLYLVAGSSLVEVVSGIYPSSGVSSTVSLVPAFFDVGDRMVLIYRNMVGGVAAWRSVTFEASPLDPSDVTSSVTAVNIAPVGLGASDTGLMSWVDAETDPANPQVYLFWGSSAGNWAYGRYVDSATQVTGVDSGVLISEFALPAGGSSDGGIRISPGGSDARVLDLTVTPASGGLATVSFKVVSLVSSDEFNATLWYSYGTNQFGQAALTGTPTGGTAARDGHTITGVEHDTTTTFSWDLGANGIADDTPLNIQLRLVRTA